MKFSEKQLLYIAGGLLAVGYLFGQLNASKEKKPSFFERPFVQFIGKAAKGGMWVMLFADYVMPANTASDQAHTNYSPGDLNPDQINLRGGW